jgi:hypothetical protein
MSKPTHRVGIFIKSGKKDFFLKLAGGWEHTNGKGIALDIPPGISLSGRVHIFVNDTSAEGTEQPQ